MSRSSQEHIRRAREVGPAPHHTAESKHHSQAGHNRWVAKILSLVALLGAVAIEWMLVNMPDSDISKQFPATVRANEQIVTFTGPTSLSRGSFSFTYDPPSGAEKVLLDADFDNAQLSQQTLETLHRLQISAPSSSGVITHTTSSAGGSACTTKVQVEPGAGNPTSVEFSQDDTSISSRYRNVGARYIGAEAMVTLTTQGPLQAGLSPCRVTLSIGDWKQLTQGFVPITVRVQPGGAFRLHWQNLSEQSSTWKTDSPSLPLLDFGSSRNDGFRTEAIAINSLNPTTRMPDNPPALQALGSKQAPLTVSSFLISQDQLEINASGKGRSLKGGSAVRVNVLQRLNDYPIPSALFAAGNLALIGWVKQAFFPRRKRPKAS